MKVKSILRRQFLPLKLRSDRLDLRLSESERLEIGQTEIGLAQAWLQRDAAPIDRYRIVVSSDRSQSVTEAHPGFRLFGEVLQEVFIASDCSREVSNSSQ